jgi:hypothetical protein
MKKVIVAAVAAVVATTSLALAQTGSTGTAGTTTTTKGTSRGADPGITDRNAAQDSPSAGDKAGSGTPGTRTTGAGMAPSDRASGSKSGN